MAYTQCYSTLGIDKMHANNIWLLFHLRFQNGDLFYPWSNISVKAIVSNFPCPIRLFFIKLYPLVYLVLRLLCSVTTRLFSVLPDNSLSDFFE